MCWIVKAAIVAYWAATAHDRDDIPQPSFMAWDAAKLTVRGLTTAFLMFLFMKVNARALPLNNPTERINHFLVPVVMLGIFSVFIETLIDQYVGPVDKTLRFVVVVVANLALRAERFFLLARTQSLASPSYTHMLKDLPERNALLPGHC